MAPHLLILYFYVMSPHFTPTLENEQLLLRPLQEADYPALFAIASDPLIWEQHPHPDRWKPEVFRVFFDASLRSNGAFVIIDKRSGSILGSTRYYEYDEQAQCVVIGGTFLSRSCWGTGVNSEVKKLMLDHIFEYLPLVYFYIDRYNIRSRIAISRLGARHCGEKPMGGDFIDYVYRITREDWLNRESASADPSQSL